MDSNVPIYGNYHGFVRLRRPQCSRSLKVFSYYSKRPFVNDPRLALLPVDIFVGKRVLDVGCNEGYVTCEIGESRYTESVTYG